MFRSETPWPTHLDGRTGPGNRAPRDCPSPLARGDIGPRQVWHAVVPSGEAGVEAGEPAGKLLGKCMGEFCYHLVYHFPEMTETPLRHPFRRPSPWAPNLDRRHFSALAPGAARPTRSSMPDAELCDHRLDAQPGADGGGELSGQCTCCCPGRRGRPWVRDCLVDAGRGVERPPLAVVAGLRCRCRALLRVFNSVSSGREVRCATAHAQALVTGTHRLPDPLAAQAWSAPPLVLQGGGVRLGRDYFLRRSSTHSRRPNPGAGPPTTRSRTRRPPWNAAGKCAFPLSHDAPGDRTPHDESPVTGAGITAWAPPGLPRPTAGNDVVCGEEGRLGGHSNTVDARHPRRHGAVAPALSSSTT